MNTRFCFEELDEDTREFVELLCRHPEMKEWVRTVLEQAEAAEQE